MSEPTAFDASHLPDTAKSCLWEACFEAPSLARALMTAQGRILQANREWGRLLGYEAEAVRGQGLDAFVHPHDASAVAGMIEKLGASVDGHSLIEKRFLRKSGGFVPVRIRVARIEVDTPGLDSLILCTAEDISEHKRKEEALVRRAGELRLLFDVVPDIFALFDRDRRCRYVNPAIEAYTGRPPVFFQGKTPRESDESGSLDELWGRALAEVFETGLDASLECAFSSLDGTRHLHTRGVPVVDESGEATSCLCISRDITDLKMAEFALRESEDRFRRLADSAPVMIWLSGPDKGLTYVNRGWSDFRGATKGEDLGDGWINAIHPDDRESCIAIYFGAFDARAEYEMEYRMRGAQGQFSHILERGRPRYAADGRFLGYVGVCVDISAVYAAQESAFQSRKRIQFLIEHLPCAIWTVDTNLAFTNAAGKGLESINLRPEDFPGRSLFDLFETNDPEHPSVRAHLLALQGEAQTFDIEFRNACFHITLEPLRDMDKRIIGVIGVSQDITAMRQAEKEKRNLEAQIQHAQKLESLGVLAGGIAHDFNNLLVGVLGHADLALLALPGASPAREPIEQIQVAAQRAADLCKQMLAYSGKGRFMIKPVDLTEIVREMGYLLEVSIAKKATLKYHLAQNLPRIEADETQLRQVIMNLITNASDAIGERTGIITVATGAHYCSSAYLGETYLNDQLEEGLHVYVEVSDTGCGMDAETRSRIFEPFFTTKFTGRGLGLAAVLGIVRGHKGAIKVYSEPGRGTTFKVFLPTTGQALEHEIRPDMSQAAWRGKGTVLVVDDDETVRSVTRRALEHAGLNVLTAPDGPEALEMYARRHKEISLILLDMTMPRMSGDEVFREIRQVYPGARVILMSGFTEQDATDRFPGKGLEGFMQKPFRLSELIDRVRKAIESAPDS